VFDVLKTGDRNVAVAALQDLLNRTGALLVCDGDFGIGTERCVRECQALAGLDVTGVADPKLQEWLAKQPEPSTDIPTAAVVMLVKFEIGTRAGYDAEAACPHWPGGKSGITIGLGYDLRFHSLEEFRRDWEPHLALGDLNRLTAFIGKPGSRAAVHVVADIVIPFRTAWAVFCGVSLPKCVMQTRRAFPDFETLPPLCRGALVSLVYNRGAALDGDDRREMRAIRDSLAAGKLTEVPAQYESMTRLWPKAAGLRARRMAEAELWRRGLAA